MSKHTPGPWAVEHDSCVMVTTAGAAQVITWLEVDNYDDLPVILADAHLIAAAPDLLAVARRWLRVMGPAASRCACNQSESYVCCACEVKSAIDRAEGKS